MPKIKPRSSRRAPPLKDSDYDHEINLVDHSASELSAGEESLRQSTSEPTAVAGPSSPRRDSLPSGSAVVEEDHDGEHPGNATAHNDDLAPRPPVPSVEVDGEFLTPIDQGSIRYLLLILRAEPTEDSQAKAKHQRVKVKPKSPETSIDILYENQRGGFLCGMPLFSSKALGNLDPSPWTNSVHKTSPTDPRTAQVPDPSWEWAWPEWRINHDDGVDADGWEYSFMFAKKFSWHGPSWWNSFVRRRVWIRRRIKTNTPYTPQDPLSLNPEYFTVRPASMVSHSRSPSRATTRSRRESVLSSSTNQVVDVEDIEKPDIEDMQSLLYALRRSRIDREKIDAINNYLEHGKDDLAPLQEEMHEIMSLFVFQASRKVLLARLTEVHDEAQRKLEGDKSADLSRRAENLSAAIKHADEEVRKLEYWSDVQAMADSGKSIGAVGGQGWDDTWQGLDKSGPSGPDLKRGQP